jgi:tetratricopeptide (TPR) repeat protein
MSAGHLVKLRRVFGFLLLFFALCTQARTQIRFVQVTDPHLFDEAGEASANEASGNRDALSACVKKINERVDAGLMYQFVVVTGDIGVEKIVEKLAPQRETATGKERESIEQDIRKEIDKGVGVVSSILSSSKVRLWLFVPGNNDLVKENPKSIEYYHLFIEQLEAALKPHGIEVRDLCPVARNEAEGPYAKSAAYVYGPYAFIGFNNASFKNDDDSQRLVTAEGGSGGVNAGEMKLNPDELKRIQGRYVEQVKAILDGTSGVEKFSFAYVFYHIPDVDDPYLISGNKESKDEYLKKKLDERQRAVDAKVIDEPTMYSSWFVHRDVRAAWYSLVNDDRSAKLAGLFAGHLHDWKRETYENFHWLKSTGYPSASLLKLYICPPLAVKLQANKPDQARGFMEVAIDAKGRVLDEWGRSGVRIFWYNAATESFTSDENGKEVEALNQLTLGGVYEDTGRLDEAEAAYTKALESKSPATRERAAKLIQRVAEKRVFPLNRYFFTPWGFSLSLEGIGLLISISLLLIFTAMWVGGKRLKNVPSLLDLIVFSAGFVLIIFVLRMTLIGGVISAGLLLILLAVLLAGSRLRRSASTPYLFRQAVQFVRRGLKLEASTAYRIMLAVVLAAPVLVPWPTLKGMLILDCVLSIWLAMWLAGRRLKVSPSIAYILTLTAGFVALIFLLWLAGNLLSVNSASISPRKAIALTVVAIMLDLWLLSLILKMQGRNVLVVNPLTDTTEHKLGATFPYVLFLRWDDIMALRGDTFVTDKPDSFVMLGEGTELPDLIESAVPGGIGKAIAWLVRKASQPQYRLRGSLQPVGTNLMMLIIILESEGRDLKMWSVDFRATQLTTVQRDLAYKVLIYIENPELYGNEI